MSTVHEDWASQISHAQIIKETLLEISALLVRARVSVVIDHDRAELRARNPETGLSQMIHASIEHGAIHYFWRFPQPGSTDIAMGPIEPSDVATRLAIVVGIREP